MRGEEAAPQKIALAIHVQTVCGVERGHGFARRIEHGGKRVDVIAAGAGFNVAANQFVDGADAVDDGKARGAGFNRNKAKGDGTCQNCPYRN